MPEYVYYYSQQYFYFSNELSENLESSDIFSNFILT